MDEQEARAVLDRVIDELRRMSYGSLVERYLDESEARTADGASGSTYQVEIQAFWDGGRPGDLRVIVGIDDGGWRAFSPLSADFIVAPDGSFVGE